MIVSKIKLPFALLVACLGCSKTMSAKVSQPNPFVSPQETLRQSEILLIESGDMDLRVPVEAGILTTQRFILKNTAWFSIVSRDRLRFHIQLEHKFSEWTNLEKWQAVLVVDGKRYLPDSVDPRKPQHKTVMWEEQRQSAVKDAYGNIIQLNQDHYKNRTPLKSIDYYQGKGDLTFYSRDIFSARAKEITLILKKRSLTYRFTWTFVEE